MVHESAEILVQVVNIAQRRHSADVAIWTNDNNSTLVGRDSICCVGSSSQTALDRPLVDEYPVKIF